MLGCGICLFPEMYFASNGISAWSRILGSIGLDEFINTAVYKHRCFGKYRENTMHQDWITWWVKENDSKVLIASKIKVPTKTTPHNIGVMWQSHINQVNMEAAAVFLLVAISMWFTKATPYMVDCSNLLWDKYDPAVSEGTTLPHVVR